MRFYGIDFVAHELDVHPFSLRRSEENGLISPERATMGKTTLKIYDEKTMRVRRRAKVLMDSGMSVWERLAAPKMGAPMMKSSSGRNSTMIDVEAIRRLNNYDTHSMIRVLEVNEDRLYHWMVLGSVSVVREGLDRAIEYVQALRTVIKAERPDYVSPLEAL